MHKYYEHFLKSIFSMIHCGWTVFDYHNLTQSCNGAIYSTAAS